MIFDPTIRARYDFTKNREVVCGLPMLNPVTPDFANGDVATIAIALPLGNQVLFSVLTTAGLVTLTSKGSAGIALVYIEVDGVAKATVVNSQGGGDIVITLGSTTASASVDMYYANQQSGTRFENVIQHSVDLSGADGIELHPGTTLYQISTAIQQKHNRLSASDIMLFDYDAPVCDEYIRPFLESNHVNGVASVSDTIWANGNYLKQHDETVIRWMCVKDEVPFVAAGVPVVDTSKDLLYRMELRCLKNKCALLCQGVLEAAFDRVPFKVNGIGVQSFTSLVRPNHAIRSDHKPTMYVQNWIYPGDRYDLAQRQTFPASWETLNTIRVLYFLPAPCTVIKFDAVYLNGTLTMQVNGKALQIVLTPSTVEMTYDGQKVGTLNIGTYYSNISLTFYKGKATFRVGTQERFVRTARSVALQQMLFTPGHGGVSHLKSPFIVAVGEEPGIIQYDSEAYYPPVWEVCVKKGKEIVTGKVISPDSSDYSFQLYKPLTLPITTDKYMVAILNKSGAVGTTITFGSLIIEVTSKVVIASLGVDAAIAHPWAMVQVFNDTELVIAIEGREVYRGERIEASSLVMSAPTYPSQNHIIFVGVADTYQYRELPSLENNSRKVNFNTAGAVKLPYTHAEVTGEFDYIDVVPEELETPREHARVTSTGMEVYEVSTEEVVRSKAVVTSTGMEVYEVATTKLDGPKPVILQQPLSVYRLDVQEAPELTVPELTQAGITVFILNRI